MYVIAHSFILWTVFFREYLTLERVVLSEEGYLDHNIAICSYRASVILIHLCFHFPGDSWQGKYLWSRLFFT